MKALILQEPYKLHLESQPVPEIAPGEVRVRVAFGGICGSDLHYFLHGGFGVVRMNSPMILGHELSGVVDAVGKGVSRVAPGQKVAINPSLACGNCGQCRDGRPRHCEDMRFMGSAMRNPPIQGGFREFVVCTEAQAVPFDGDNIEEAALAEPLSVCLHAVSQAPDLRGKRVLVTGFGPIGALCMLAARHSGAATVGVTDIASAPLELADRLGADNVYDVRQADALADETQGKGQVDILFECSGHPAALASAIGAVKPGGAVIQVGMLPDTVQLSLNPLITKEITYRGTFRFDKEFDEAVALIAERHIDVRPLISARFKLSQAEAAFAEAQDRTRAVKVLFDMTG